MSVVALVVGVVALAVNVATLWLSWVAYRNRACRS